MVESKQMKIRVLYSIFAAVILSSFLFFSNVHALTCGQNNVIASTPSYWGIDPNQNVIASNNSQVRISIRGEDGCAGQTAQFQIKEGSNITSTINLNLIQGQPIQGQSGAFILFGDWTINLQPGTYKIKLINVGGQIFSSSDSPNTLTVQSSAQACNISKLSTNPAGGVRAGQQIQLIVEAQGVCQGWGATINILDSNNTSVFSGSQQQFSGGNNTLNWNWTPPNPQAPQAVYTFEANLGNQNLKSSPFTVTRVSGGAPLPPPGPTDSYTFQIDNPIAATDLIDLLKEIYKFIFQISIPIAVILIIWVGIKYLISGGNPVKIVTANKALLYIVIGLTVILIGQGFITLIESILNLGGPAIP